MENKDINAMVNDAILYLMRTHAPKPMTQLGLSEISGVDRATLSNNLRGKRGWSVAMLDRVAAGLGVLPEDIIATGRELQHSNNVFPHPRALACTPARSVERLKVIITAAVGEGSSLALLVNPDSVRAMLPEAYAGYLDGRVSDGEMFVALKKEMDRILNDTMFMGKLDEKSTKLIYG